MSLPNTMQRCRRHSFDGSHPQGCRTADPEPYVAHVLIFMTQTVNQNVSSITGYFWKAVIYMTGYEILLSCVKT